VAVTQKYLVVTSNYEARAAGVTKLMGLADALKACPHLVTVSSSSSESYSSSCESYNKSNRYSSSSSRCIEGLPTPGHGEQQQQQQHVRSSTSSSMSAPTPPKAAAAAAARQLVVVGRALLEHCRAMLLACNSKGCIVRTAGCKSGLLLLLPALLLHCCCCRLRFLVRT
jgi:hypothetical protein